MTQDLQSVSRNVSNVHGKLPARVAIGAVLIGIVLSLTQGGDFVDHISPWLTALGAIAGLALGTWLSVGIAKSTGGDFAARHPVKRLIAIVTAPFFFVPLGTYLVRYSVYTAAFTATTGAVNALEFGVTDKDTKWQNKAGVTLGPNARSIDVRIDYELYSRLEPWREKGRDCLALPVEQGRWNLRRVIAPSYLETPLGIETYRECSKRSG